MPSFKYQKEGVQIAMWHSAYGFIDPANVKIKITLESFNHRTKKFQTSNYWSLDAIAVLEEGLKELDAYLTGVMVKAINPKKKSVDQKISEALDIKVEGLDRRYTR